VGRLLRHAHWEGVYLVMGYRGAILRDADNTVLASRERHSVREFVEKALACIDRSIEWRGSGINEKGIEARSGQVLIEVDDRYFRPTEVDLLVGDPSKAQTRLGWRHKTSFDAMVKEMVAQIWRRALGNRAKEPP
jgi:GDPmannose 4,6-dehydratase